MITFDLSVILL